MTIMRVIPEDLYQTLKNRNLLNIESLPTEAKKEPDPTPINFLETAKHDCKSITGWVTFEDKFKAFK